MSQYFSKLFHATSVLTPRGIGLVAATKPEGAAS